MRRLLLLLMLGAFLVPTLVPGVAAALTSQPSSLTILLSYDGAPLSGIEIAACQVATVAEEAGGLRYTVTPTFAGANPDFADLTKEKNIATAKSLDAYAHANNIARNSKTTNSEGAARYTDIEPGLYLVAQLDVATSEYILAPYLVAVPALHEDRTGYEHDVIAHPKTELQKRDPNAVSISVSKIWEGSGTHPASVSVRLLRNGQRFGSDITLNANNNWRHTWQGLNARDTWTVDEVNVPAGYAKTVSGDVTNGFIITNTRQQNPPPTTPPPTTPPSIGGGGNTSSNSPKTGDTGDMRLWLALGTFGLMGLVLVVVSIKTRRKNN